MSSLFLSVTKGGILSAVFIGTEFVFTPLYVNASHFKFLFSLDTLGFSAQIAHIQNPLDCRPDGWARELRRDDAQVECLDLYFNQF